MMLIEAFGDEEVREAVWECGSSKNLGLDSFKFKFIKESLCFMKHDILNFLQDLHVNVVIARGCNASFIILIPKVVDP